MASKKQQIAAEIAKAVSAGKAVALETVDFSDPNRPKTCLEVDFPILPVNQVASIEGNAGKPIYQMSKWWARRRSSVFRSMLIAAAAKAPDDPARAAKHVWDHYYANHQKKGAFKTLRVADIFMGGGTTLVEGSRLGMQMFGNDLNPVAWFVVKQAFAKVDLEEVKRLLADIEAEVKPQIMPFYYCDGPNGEKGKWTHIPSGRVEGLEFDPLTLTPGQRRDYRYEGPEVIYTFWAKHGPCQVTGCGHRTPIMSSPVIAVKTLSLKHWELRCETCSAEFHVEEKAARMAPDAPLYVAPTETPYTILDRKRGVVCPQCGHAAIVKLDKGKSKKVELSLLVRPEWLAGLGTSGNSLGGSVQDSAADNANWFRHHANTIGLLEVRGALPTEIICQATGVKIRTDTATVPKKSHFTCAACGTLQDVLATVSASGKSAPAAPVAIQAWSPTLDGAYRGRFFSKARPEQIIAAEAEWVTRSRSDLAGYWPDSPIERGLETSVRTPLLRYGYSSWKEFFNPRQLLVHALILRAIDTLPGAKQETREYVLAGFQQYLRSQNMFCIWDKDYDKLVPFLSKNNLQPPTRPVENCVFGALGRGNWTSCTEALVEALTWRQQAPQDIAGLGGRRLRSEASPPKVSERGEGHTLDLLEFARNAACLRNKAAPGRAGRLLRLSCHGRMVALT